jgi:hypothetical protein
VELGAVEKLLFIYLFSNSRACLTGIHDLSLRTAAFEADLSVEEVTRIVARFQRDGRVYYEDGLVWVPIWLRYNASNLTSAKKQTMATREDVADMLQALHALYPNSSPIPKRSFE